MSFAEAVIFVKYLIPAKDRGGHEHVPSGRSAVSFYFFLSNHCPTKKKEEEEGKKINKNTLRFHQQNEANQNSGRMSRVAAQKGHSRSSTLSKLQLDV